VVNHRWLPYVLPVVAAIFGILVTLMSESVHTSPGVLLDYENVGVAFEISLLSNVEAEITHYSICTSGNGGNL